jgi:hypothetical protein
MFPIPLTFIPLPANPILNPQSALSSVALAKEGIAVKPSQTQSNPVKPSQTQSHLFSLYPLAFSLSIYFHLFPPIST